MTSIVTEECARLAIQMALPTIREICNRWNWGPKGVVIVVQVRNKKQVIHVMEELDPKSSWEYDFEAIALDKARLALREGRPTSEIHTSRPWLLQEGDTLYGGGVAEDTTLAVGVSGLYDQADEVIGWIIFNIIAGFCAMALKDRREDEDNIRI